MDGDACDPELSTRFWCQYGAIRALSDQTVLFKGSNIIGIACSSFFVMGA
jgi:hypothetical protein